ncbi:peptidase M28 [Aliidiomarina taiwanensis]|uniref:Peptidase M28 n=1 Tax=Aliidiomarina taiwanensis TaxID=946228 RepID=A0A432XB10_9GAMM|nr:peptidase M28 [Aliidiomarina taiwanensis]
MTFRVAHLVEGSAQLTLHDGNRDIPLTFLQDFTTSPSTLAQQLEVRAPLVFVGYGLVSERFGFDDYANHDVTDSIVVTISGLPEGLPSEEAAHLGRIKTELAIERGAIGVITIHTPEREAVRPFDTIRKYAKSARRMTWLSPEGRPNSTHQKLLGSAYLHYEAAEQLFEHVGFSLDDVWQQIADNKMPPSAELGLSATLSKASVFEEVQSANVIAKLPGTNPVLRDEVVLYTAHSDHLGLVNNSGNPAKVYNGALDNAAGVAVMLETARMFVDAAKQGDTLDRTVMFAAVTAEERGLLGADYFAHFPTTPIENIVANVNLDMPVLLYNFADVVAFGAEHSSLGDVVATAAEQYGISRSPDPMPEQAIFTRSDHYALVKKGIPAVFLMTGFQSQHDDEDGGQVWADFFAEHYHQHSDEISTLSEQYGGIRYDAGVVFSQINYEIGYLIGTAQKRPEWLPESYFGQVFGGHRATPMEQESHE